MSYGFAENATSRITKPSGKGVSMGKVRSIRPESGAAMAHAHAIISDRIEEAAETLRRMPDKERSILRRSERGQTWPLMLHQATEHAAYEGIKVRLPPPSAARITRMHEVLDWLLDLARMEPTFFKPVWLICAERREIGKVARILGIDPKTVHRRKRAGLTLIAVAIRPRLAA